MQTKVDNVKNAVEALKARYREASEGDTGWGGFNAKLGSPVGKKFMKEWFGNSFGVTTEINQATGNRKSSVTPAAVPLCTPRTPPGWLAAY